MPLDATVGRARVIEIQDPVSIKPNELDPHRVGRGERVLFKTQNSTRRWWAEDFVEDFVYVSQEAARSLTDRGVRSVGVACLSIVGFTKTASRLTRSSSAPGLGHRRIRPVGDRAG